MPSKNPPSSEDVLHHSDVFLSDWERGHIWPTRTRRSTSNHSTRDGARSSCSSQSRHSRYSSRDSRDGRDSRDNSVGNSLSRESSVSRRSQKCSSLKSHGYRDWSRRGGSCKKQVPTPDEIVFCPEPPFSRDPESEDDEDEVDDEEDEGTRYGVRYPDNSRTTIGPESFTATPNSDGSIEPAAAWERHQSGEPEDQWDEDDEAARYQAKVTNALEHIRRSREHRAEPGYRPPKHRNQRSSRDA